MAPKLGDIGQMEVLSASETPSAEGAWWIMLQTAESICNAASLRDPVNNAYMSEFWSETVPGVENFVSQDGNRPLPYDDLMQMVSFCGGHLQEIVKKPRHNLVKVDRMVRPEKAKDIGYKTINWLGKQPGKTVREKMAGKNTLLTQKKEYSYDIKENQAAMMLYTQLMRRVSDRINNGVNKKAYDASESPQMEQMRKIKKLLRESPLGEVKAKNQNQANNVLLSDKNYSIIWRAYMDMARFDARVEKRWEQALELFVQSVFLAINAELCTYDDLYVVEDRIKLQDIQRMNVSYILGCHYCIPYVVELSLDRKMISVRIYGGNRPEYIKELRFTFSDAVSKEELIPLRGTPLYVEVKEDGKSQRELFYADLSCVKEIAGLCKNICFDFANIEPVRTEDVEYTRNGFTASVSFDIVSNGVRLGIAGDGISLKDRFYSDKAVVYTDQSGFTAVYPNGLQRLHMKSNEEIAVRNAVLTDDSRGLKAVLDELHGKVTLSQDDYFFYLVPDALEEIRQRNLKQCIKGCFTRTFPVWRSVAGLVTRLADPDYEFHEDSIFVYMDLVGDTATAGLMTIHYEDILKNYTCNHFPPFPQNEAGDSITEDAFCASYVREFAGKHHFTISDDAVRHLVEDGSIRELLSDRDKNPYANYFYDNKGSISMYQITYDEELVSICVNGWLDRIYKFWNIVSERLGNKTVNYVYFISDLIQFVTKDDLKTLFTEGQWSNMNDIFQSDNGRLLEGALIYKDRLNKHLPIWTEYLPKLSLKIPIQGKYVEWDLIDEDKYFNVMDEDIEFPVKEQTPLRLHAGADEYCFELKKEDISRKPSRIEAYIPIKDRLECDIDVNMFIRYKYGSDESYELILRPLHAKGAPFEELKAEWRSGYREKRNVGGPKFPPLKSSKEIERDVEFIKGNLLKTYVPIKNFLCDWYDYDRVSERFKFDQICKFLTINTFKLRDTLRYYDFNEGVQDFVEWFFDSELYGCCVELMTLDDVEYLSEKFLDDYKDSDGLKKLRSCATQLIYSFGAYVPCDFQQYLADNYHDFNFEFKQSILMNSVYNNTDNESLWYLLLKLFQKKPYSIILNIRSLSNLCWCDEDMVPKLGLYPALVSEIINFSVDAIKGMLTMTPDNPKYESAGKRYLSVIEVILAILRLRENPEFDLLVAGSKEATELADLIREVDDIMGNPESRIKLMVNKPEALRNMSNIAYAIDMYLTGNEGVDSIEVLSVESDE